MSNLLTYLADMPGGIKRKELNYQELWQSFITSQAQAAEYAEQTNRYNPKMSGSRTGVDGGGGWRNIMSNNYKKIMNMDNTIDHRGEIVKIANEVVENDLTLIRLVSKLKGDDFKEMWPKVEKSLQESERLLKTLTNE